MQVTLKLVPLTIKMLVEPVDYLPTSTPISCDVIMLVLMHGFVMLLVLEKNGPSIEIML